MGAAVAASQRWTRDRPCPICGGCERDPRGQGKRCIGFLSDDGEWVRCSREEHAGGLDFEQRTECYVHRRRGPCRCGQQHGEADTDRRPLVAARESTWDYRDENGELLFQVVRRDRPGEGKTYKQRRSNGAGGWIWNRGDAPRVLYRLPELRAAEAVESLNAAIAPTWEDDVHTLREAAEILRRRANRLSDGDAKEGLRVSAVRCVLQAALIEAENAKEQSP